MLNLGKKNIVGILVNAIDYEAAAQGILEAAAAGRKLAVAALAVHGVMTGVLDAEHKFRLNSLDLVVPDGQPVRWALNWLHSAKLKDRVYGPNLTLAVCDRASKVGLPVFFYGSRQEVLISLCRNLKMLYPDLIIAGARPSYFRPTSEEEKREVVQQIEQSGARIVFVGLGCPRQEVWVYEYRAALDMPLLAVGAAFDFHAKTISQAPKIMQRLGLEWLYRLILEPRRLWKRYVILNPLYMFCLFLQYFGIKNFEASSATIPARNLNYG